METTAPERIAHRGASADFTENTLAAFDEALRQGCDAVELDLQLSRDGAVVAWHDRTLTRLSFTRRGVHHLDLADLQGLAARQDPARGVPFPGLDEILERYGERTRLLLEIKTREPAATARHADLMRRTVAAVTARQLEDRIRILCYDHALLELCRELAPDLPRVLNYRPPGEVPDDLLPRLETVAALSASLKRLTPGFVAGLKRVGFPLYVFTCNTPRQLRRSFEYGAVAIMSDRPGWLRQTLEQQQGAVP